MTDIQRKTFEAVKQLEFKLGYKPQPKQVADHLGKDVNNLICVLRRLDLYDETELLTESEQLVMDVYYQGVKAKEIELLTGLSPAMVKHMMNSLAEKGLIVRKKYKKHNRDEAPPTYIEITKGLYQGYRGYIGKNEYCTVFDNVAGELFEVTERFDMSDYEIIERRL